MQLSFTDRKFNLLCNYPSLTDGSHMSIIKSNEWKVQRGHRHQERLAAERFADHSLENRVNSHDT